MTTGEDQVPLIALSDDECMELLHAHSVGRLAVAFPDEAPLVVPVNYLMDGTAVVFRSDAGEKVTRLRRQRAAFQIDEFDHAHRVGWSVLVQGIAYEASHFEIEHLSLAPWAVGDKPHWFRLVASGVTGRRLQLPEWVRPSTGYL